MLILMFLLGLFSFSPEQIAITLVGAIVATGVTQWFKRQTGLVNVGAMLLAVLISFVIAITAFTASQTLAGDFSAAQIPAAAVQIFGLATIIYKALLADEDV